MFHSAAPRAGRALVVSICAFVLVLSVGPSAQNAASGERMQRPQAPNYELAARWTAQKVSTIVFDTSVTPHWLETSDRFWYSYQTREGRRFFLVDPIRKTRAPLFDHAKMAATLTTIIRTPYDAQHLPFQTVKFVKRDAAFEFEVQVPKDADIVTTKRKDTTEVEGGSLRPVDPPQTQRFGAQRAGGERRTSTASCTSRSTSIRQKSTRSSRSSIPGRRPRA